MKLVCPSCSAVCSADAWLNDADCRATFAKVCSLPAPLPKVCLSYFSLFRPGTRALSWKKALRLATEIEELTTKGYVKLKGKVDRDCPPRIWAQAMEQMVEQRDRLTTPMPNHNYLRKIAWDLADREDALGEKRRFPSPARPRKSSDFEAINTMLPKSLNPMDQYVQGLRDDKPSQQEMDAFYKQSMEGA